jgi:hypothetical protein
MIIVCNHAHLVLSQFRASNGFGAHACTLEAMRTQEAKG